MITDMIKEVVLSVIPWGKENAITSDEINRRAHVNDPDFRTNYKTREIIKDLLINNHEPIMSSPSCGYWRTRSAADMWQYASDLKGRADEIMARREAVLDILARNTKQGELFGE